MPDEENIDDRLLEMLSFDVAAKDLSRYRVGAMELEDVEIREFVLEQAFDFTHWAVDGKQVIIKSPHGRVLLEVLDVNPEVISPAGDGIVEVTYVPNLVKTDGFARHMGERGVFVFRVFRTSLQLLSEKLRRRPEYRVPFSRDL